MKLFNNINKYVGAGLMMISAIGATFTSCSENIDESDLYTFTGQTIISHMEGEPETYSNFLTILGKVHPSKRSSSTMKELLSARGHYTCFAPTNEAVQHYIDSLYQRGEISSNQLETAINDTIDKSTRSLGEDIVFNSIIENGNQEAISSTEFPEGPLTTTNMNDRYISISYSNDAENNTLIYVNTNSLIVDADIQVENGYIHAVDQVLSPSNASIADLIEATENTTFFGSLLQITEWDKELLEYKDEAWEEKYDDIRGTTTNTRFSGDWAGIYPEHRYIGHTVFVETDSVFSSKGIIDIPTLKTWVQKNAFYGPETSWGEDYTNPDNWLNQFVAYHLLPETLTYTNMVTFANEYGCDAATMKTRTATSFYVNVWEYWETMGKQRRSVKITGIRGEKRLNRQSIYNKNTYREVVTEINIPGIKINPTNGNIDNQALNGYYYTIEDILVWNEDVPTKVLNERMRYDVTSLLPEMLTNNVRQNRVNSWYFTTDYFSNVVAMSEQTEFEYLPNTGYSGSIGSWMDYQIDEFNVRGNFDFTMKLPPVPYTGTYEIRYGINANGNRGMAQVYLGKNKNNLPAIGIPLDLRSSATVTTATGWASDASLGDEDAINENDKSMRNLGYMKGPKYMQLSNGTGRDGQNCLRRIIFNDQLEAGETYYIRFKSVLSGTSFEFFYDYLEIVPKAVYAGEEAEDKW